jgi:hypothetical protein
MKSAELSRSIGSFTNNKRASVPWRCLSQDANHGFIPSDCLPDGVMLLDPSKLRVLNISQIWDRWLARQKDGLQGLLFLKAQGGDMREKLPDARGRKGEKKYEDEDEDEDAGKDKGEGGDDNMAKNKGESGSGKDAHGSEGEKNDNGEGIGGETGEVQALSPMANEKNKKEFLKTLSEDLIYQRFVTLLDNKPMVCSYVFLTNLQPVTA